MIRLGQLPVTLKVGKKEWKIRTDYRDILVIMQAFNDPELTVEEAHVVMCKILYEGWTDMPKELYEEAAKKALWFLDCGQEDEEDIMPVKVMDWEQDEPILFPAINQVAGCEVRSVPCSTYLCIGFHGCLGSSLYCFLEHIINYPNS